MTVNIHATAVQLGTAGKPFGAPPGTGILILGKSGAGKSDLALRLMAAGALLVADDRTDLYVSRSRLYAKAPKQIAGLLEVRGVGIVTVPFVRQIQVALVVNLAKPSARMPERCLYQAPAALRLPPENAPPVISLHPFEASAPAKLAVAAAAFVRGLFREDINAI